MSDQQPPPWYKRVLSSPYLNLTNVVIVIVTSICVVLFVQKVIFKRKVFVRIDRPGDDDISKVIAVPNKEFVIYYQAMDPTLLELGYVWSNGPVLEKSVTNRLGMDVGKSNTFIFTNENYESLLIKKIILYNINNDIKPSHVKITKQAYEGSQEVSEVKDFTETETPYGEEKSFDVNYTMPLVLNDSYLVRCDKVLGVGAFVSLLCEMNMKPEKIEEEKGAESFKYSYQRI